MNLVKVLYFAYIIIFCSDVIYLFVSQISNYTVFKTNVFPLELILFYPVDCFVNGPATRIVSVHWVFILPFVNKRKLNKTTILSNHLIIGANEGST